jgi:putative transposase
MLIKSTFSRQIPNSEYCRKCRTLKRERGIWQRKLWEHCIRGVQDFIRHVDSIQYKPVNHGYVEKASHCEHSSIHRYIQKKLLDKEWRVPLDLRFKEKFGEV